MRHLPAAAATISMLCSGTAFAQDAKPTTITLKQEAAEHDGIFGFDYGTPSSPALSIAGLSAEKTTVQSSLKPFVLSLPSLVDGAASQAAAVDLAPAWIILRGNGRRIDDYEDNGYIYQAFNRLRVGWAGTNGDYADGKTAKQKPSRMAAGLSLSLLNSSDPLLLREEGSSQRAFDNCLSSIPTTALVIGASNASSLVYAETERLMSAIDGGSVSEDQLKSLQEMYGAPGAARSYPLSDPDARTIESLTYLLGQAEKAGNAADVDFYRRKLAEAAIPRQAVASGARHVLTKKEIAFYAPTVKADMVARKAAQEKAASTISTDFGYLAAAKQCGQRVTTLALYRPQVIVGYAHLWRGAAGKFRGFDDGGNAIWAGVRFPVSAVFGGKPDADAKGPVKSLMIGLSARYGRREYLETGDQTTPLFRANSVNAWGGVEYIDKQVQLAAQVGWFDARANDHSFASFSKNGTRWLLSTKLRVSGSEGGTWLGAAYGHANSNTTSLQDKSFLLTVTVGPPSIPNLFGQKGSAK